jgi:hypothetical protein
MNCFDMGSKGFVRSKQRSEQVLNLNQQSFETLQVLGKLLAAQEQTSSWVESAANEEGSYLQRLLGLYMESSYRSLTGSGQYDHCIDHVNRTRDW